MTDLMQYAAALEGAGSRALPPVTVLRRADGGRILTLEEADFSELLATGWSWPVPFRVKARDGVTELYGYLYFPSAFDSTSHYPVVDYIYPGPQIGPALSSVVK